MNEDILGLWVDGIGIRGCDVPVGHSLGSLKKKCQNFLKALHSLPVPKLTPFPHPVSSASVTTERGDNLPSVHTQQISKCIHTS